ncbi:hypothetical protein LSPH24S_00112 [Lysinibacillus sphaericus]
MDRHSAMTLLHEEAIYLHQGIQYQVEKLDWEEKKAFVREVDVDYYTDANLAVEMKVLEEDRSRIYQGGTISFGDVGLVAQATIFKKISLNDKQDNIGSVQSIYHQMKCIQARHGCPLAIHYNGLRQN